MEIKPSSIYGIIFEGGTIEILSIGSIYTVEYEKYEESGQAYFSSFISAHSFFVDKLKELAKDSPLHDFMTLRSSWRS